jgi:D-alanine transaminase/branched-chain amino acid aminotransferase
MQYVIVNGETVSASEASLRVTDLGLLRGYAVFDYFRVLKGTPLFLEDYLSRFENSVRHLGYALPVSRGQLEAQVQLLIASNRLDDAGVQLLLTGGYSEDGFTPAAPNLVLLARPLKPLGATLYSDGARLITHQYRRDIPEAKTTNYAVAIHLLPKQREFGAIDVLYHNGEVIYETARSNIFVLRRDGVLVTPKRDVLPGITRKHVLNLARALTKVEETDVYLSELQSAQEVFITSSLKGVMPITHIDAQPVADGKVGRLSQTLKARFEAHVHDYLSAAV